MKKINKNKVLHEIKQIELSIAGCNGCSDCRDGHEKIHKLKVSIGLNSKLPDFSYLDRNQK